MSESYSIVYGHKHVSFLSFNRLLFCKTWEKRKKGLKIFVNFLVNQYCSVSCIIYPSFNWFQLPRQQGPVINCVKYLGYSFLLHHPLSVINSFKDLQVEYLSQCSQCLSSYISQNLHFPIVRLTLNCYMLLKMLKKVTTYINEVVQCNASASYLTPGNLIFVPRLLKRDASYLLILFFHLIREFRSFCIYLTCPKVFK